MRSLAAWLQHPDPEAFPYDDVVTAFHRGGKHFVDRDLLVLLDRARATAPRDPVLTRFLSCALDKFDGRFDNPSYLAIDQLSLPGADGTCDAGRRDRLFALLVADLLRHEVAAASGATDLLPEMRPDARVTAKRCRHGVRAARPALARLGLDATLTEPGDPLVAARAVWSAVDASLTAAERRMLQLTLVPVYVLHDEYMFIRVLQAYETTFSAVAVHLRTARTAVLAGSGRDAVRALDAAESAMREARPLFSLVATMAPQAFLTFREYTDGASAIQSRSYKTVESLCRRPERPRVDSPAYESVPDVREKVLAGRPTLDEAVEAARADGRLADEVVEAMQRFEDAVLHWRHTHYRLAVRMLGQRRGTGYTEGVPYLERAKSIPVFEARRAA